MVGNLRGLRAADRRRGLGQTRVVSSQRGPARRPRTGGTRGFQGVAGTMNPKQRAWIVLAVLAASSACGYFPESSFSLASESPLPVWFKRDDRPRESVTVHLDYYIKSGRWAVLELQDPKTRKVLSEVRASLRGLYPIESINGRDTSPRSYEVASANGVEEVFEHRGMSAGDVFWICEDREVRAALLERSGS